MGEHIVWPFFAAHETVITRNPLLLFTPHQSPLGEYLFSPAQFFHTPLRLADNGPIALAGTRSGPGIGEGDGAHEPAATVAAGKRARDRPAVPGHRVRADVSGKAGRRVTDGAGQPRRSR
jgi:hypothetical protein